MININPALVTQSVSMSAIKEKEHGELALKILNLISYLGQQVPAIVFLGLVDVDLTKLQHSIELLKNFEMIKSYYRNDILILDTHEVVRENTKLLLKKEEEKTLEEALGLLKAVQEKYGKLIDIGPYLETFTDYAVSYLNQSDKF